MVWPRVLPCNVLHEYRPTTENWWVNAGYVIVYLDTPAALARLPGEFDLDISRNQCDGSTCPGYHTLTMYQGKFRECNVLERTVSWVSSDTLKADYVFFDLLQNMDFSALGPTQNEEVGVAHHVYCRFHTFYAIVGG